MSRRRILRDALIAVLVVAPGCASPSRPYRGPPPSALEPAHLSVVYSDVPAAGASLRSVALQIYDIGARCADSDGLESAYLGMLDVSRGSREVFIPGGSFVLFRIRLNAFEGDASVSCTVSGGFVPEPGRSYWMEFSALTTGQCVMSAHDEASRTIALLHPRGC